MNYNPYAAPQAAPPPSPAAQGGGAPQPWEIGEVLSQAWTTFKIHWAVLLFSLLLAGILMSTPSGISVGTTFAGAMGNPSALQSSGNNFTANGATIIGQIISAFFEVGLIRINLAAARGATPNFADLFSGGAKFAPMLGLRFLLSVAYVFGLFFLVVPFFILYCGTWAASYYLVDSDLGVMDSMKASWSAMMGQKGSFFLFLLVMLLINLGGLLACCFGIFLTAPLSQVAMAIVFLRVSGRGAAAAALPPAMGGGGYPPGYGPGGGYGGPPGGSPPGYGGPPPGAPPGGYGPGGGGGYGPPPGGGGYGPPGGGYGPPGGGGGYGGPGGPPPGR